MAEERPVMFGGSHFRQAISDESFFKKLPQFLPIKTKMAAMHADLKSKKGCSTCRQRRVQGNLERDFASILASLDPESRKVFKEHFGVGRMVVHAIDPRRHTAYLKEI